MQIENKDYGNKLFTFCKSYSNENSNDEDVYLCIIHLKWSFEAFYEAWSVIFTTINNFLILASFFEIFILFCKLHNFPCLLFSIHFYHIIWKCCACQIDNSNMYNRFTYFKRANQYFKSKNWISLTFISFKYSKTFLITIII